MIHARLEGPGRRVLHLPDGETAALEFGDATRPCDVLFIHANGFSAASYRALLAPLGESLHVLAPDLRGHGAATLAVPGGWRRDWNDHRRDLVALIDALPGPPLVLAGHSMGATCALLAAADRPGRVAGLVLADPVILPPLASRFMRLPFADRITRRWPITQAALRRRDRFDDHEVAFAAWRGRGAFRGWPDAVLADHVAGALVANGEGVRLACPPRWEASNYAAQGHDVWRAITRVAVPIHVLKAEHGSTVWGRSARLLVRRPNVTVTTVTGSTHFLPMLNPEAVRGAILDLASRANRAS